MRYLLGLVLALLLVSAFWLLRDPAPQDSTVVMPPAPEQAESSLPAAPAVVTRPPADLPPLPLELPAPVFEPGDEDDGADFSPPPDKLPSFFGTKPKQGAVSISGRPTLGYEDEDTTKPTIVGGKVDVEIKLE